MRFVKNLSELDSSLAKLAGGKGANLGELLKIGMPVPEGFVVLTSAFETFLQQAGLKEKIDRISRGLNPEIDSVRFVSAKIRDLILKAEVPNEVEMEVVYALDALYSLGARSFAVRSSATVEDSKEASWAGQLESFLHLPKDKVIEGIKKCWASIFSPRALVYRFHKGRSLDQMAVAVVVQWMINAEKAGVCFTINPVTRDYSQMIIEACWGLGEALVSGKVTPDTYVIEKDGLKIVQGILNPQAYMVVDGAGGTKMAPVPAALRESPKLSDRELNTLARLCLKIEKYFGHPCDIEWVSDGKRFYVVQARPVTVV